MAIQRKKFGVNEFAPFQAAEILDWNYVYWPDVSQTVNPSGTSFTAFGSAVVSPRVTIAPTGVSVGAFGSANVYLKTRWITPSGISDGEFGSATAYLKTRQIIPTGFNAFKDFGFGAGGAGFIDFGIRRRYPTGFDASLFGTAFLSGGVRWMYPTGLAATSMGTALVADRVRFIEPPFIAGASYGTPQIGYHRTVSPAGFDASAHGLHQIQDNRPRAYPDGFDAAAYGSPMVAFRVRPVRPVGFWSRTPDLIPEQRWGRPEVYNSRQYVQQYYEVTPSDGGVFGNYNDVANRNRVIQAYGWRDSRFPLTALVQLTGVAVTPRSVDAGDFGSTLVAHRIRHILPSGEDTAVLTQWTQVRNTAQVLPSVGAGAQAILGAPAVTNTRRYYRDIGLGEQGALGTPFVDFRVRTLTPYYTYEGGLPSEATVQFLNRPLMPRGIDASGFGVPDVEEHFSIIAPRWILVDRFGAAALHNVTPELRCLGYDQTLWGANAIHNQFENVYPVGDAATLWGRADIAYRTKMLGVSGINAARWGPNTQVRNTLPDPPGQQYILPDGINAGAFPITPEVRSNVIFASVDSDHPLTRFGTARLVNMAIGPCGGIFLTEQFGRASLNATQYVWHQQIDESTTYGKPRFSPHTIWAAPAPPQAITNNGGIWHVVDSRELPAGDEKPKFGNAIISNKNRSVAPRHPTDGTDKTDGERFGAPWISNRRRWIYPLGARPFRYGVPVLNGGGGLETQGADQLEMGTPSVAHYLAPFATQYVRPTWTPELDYGQPVVSNWIRPLPIPGFDAGSFGAARVHPPEPIIPAGWRSDVYGDTMVAHRIRTVYPTGHDSLKIAGFSGGYFSSRIRVSERMTLGPASINAGAFGRPQISN